MNILPVITDLQNLRLVARAFALFTDQFDIGEKLHLHSDRAITLTGFATATGYIEREMSGTQPTLLGLGQGSEQFADSIKGLRVSNRIRPRCASNRRLIHQ